jgi:hypothetical protein
MNIYFKFSTFLKSTFIIKITLLLLLNSSFAFAQEWKSFRSYKKETAKLTLSDGCWLKIDRKRRTSTWEKANKYNLTLKDGNSKYKTISQIRDFYSWFDRKRIELGHEMEWIGIAAIATQQLSKLDAGFIHFFIVRNNELKLFANEGSKKVFAYTFPKLKELYFLNMPIQGISAKKWDKNHSMNEQCTVLAPLFEKLSKKAYKKLDRIVKRKGIYSIGVPRKLRFEGELIDCKARIKYGNQKILPLYVAKNNKLLLF